MLQRTVFLLAFFTFSHVCLQGQCPSDCSNQNTFVGINAGRDTDGGDGNTFVGKDAGERNTNGSGNSYFGIGHI